MTGWQRLLSGKDADLAEEAVKPIASDLMTKEYAPAGFERSYPDSLAFGKAGIALFLYYMYETYRDVSYKQNARRLLDAALEAIGERSMCPDLYRGFSGIAWAFQHVKAVLYGDEDCENACDEIDDGLLVSCERGNLPAELLDGIAGICLYPLVSLERSSSRPLIHKLVDCLDRKVDRKTEGCAWRVQESIARNVKQWEKDSGRTASASAASDLYKISIAHGVVGPATILAAIHSRGIETDRAGALARDAVRWVAVQQDSWKNNQIFPDVVGTNRPQLTTGWCSGDIGIALCLFNIGTLLEWDESRELGLRIARREAQLGLNGVEEHNRFDFALCHGSAGRGHIFNCLFQATGEEIFHQAACFWFSHTLGLRPNAAWLRYRDAVEEKPGDAAIHVRLGRVSEKLGQLPQAIEQYKAAQEFAGPAKWSEEAAAALVRLQHREP